MKIIIIGAGLGGLAAALRLAMLDHEVVVLEEHASLSPRGGSLSTRPGASRVLASWGLEADLDRIAIRTEGIVMRDLVTGVITSGTDEKSASQSNNKEHGNNADAAGTSEKTPAPHWGTTREQLIQLFYDKAVEHGAAVHFECSVVNVSDEDESGDDRDVGQPARVQIILADGARLSADLVLVADGIRSQLREVVLKDLVGQSALLPDLSFVPVVSDITGYGFMLPAALLRESGLTSDLMDNVCSNVWMSGYISDDGDRIETESRNVFAVSRYSPRSESVAILCHTIDPEHNSAQETLWDDRGDMAYIRETFRGSCPAITTALDMAESCDRWRLAELPVLPRWTSRRGMVALLGDSAHAMHPSAGQGFSQIVEDVEVLAELLQRTGDVPGEVVEITKRWERIRRPRVDKIQEYSRWTTAQISQRVSSRRAQTVKPKVKDDGRRDAGDEFRDAAFLQWSLDYDVKKEVGLSSAST